MKNNPLRSFIFGVAAFLLPFGSISADETPNLPLQRESHQQMKEEREERLNLEDLIEQYRQGRFDEFLAKNELVYQKLYFTGIFGLLFPQNGRLAIYDYVSDSVAIDRKRNESLMNLVPKIQDPSLRKALMTASQNELSIDEAYAEAYFLGLALLDQEEIETKTEYQLRELIQEHMLRGTLINNSSHEKKKKLVLELKQFDEMEYIISQSEDKADLKPLLDKSFAAWKKRQQGYNTELWLDRLPNKKDPSDDELFIINVLNQYEDEYQNLSSNLYSCIFLDSNSKPLYSMKGTLFSFIISQPSLIKVFGRVRINSFAGIAPNT